MKTAHQTEQDQHEDIIKLIAFKDLGPRKGIDYSRDHLRRKWKAGTFPTPVALSDHRIAWREDEVDEWIASRPRRGDRTAGARPSSRRFSERTHDLGIPAEILPQLCGAFPDPPRSPRGPRRSNEFNIPAAGPDAGSRRRVTRVITGGAGQPVLDAGEPPEAS